MEQEQLLSLFTLTLLSFGVASYSSFQYPIFDGSAVKLELVTLVTPRRLERLERLSDTKARHTDCRFQEVKRDVAC